MVLLPDSTRAAGRLRQRILGGIHSGDRVFHAFARPAFSFSPFPRGGFCIEFGFPLGLPLGVPCRCCIRVVELAKADLFAIKNLGDYGFSAALPWPIEPKPSVCRGNVAGAPTGDWVFNGDGPHSAPFSVSG
jgi:hypothetical protein